MKRPYYLFNDGTMSRKDNTLCFLAKDENGEPKPAKYIPIETASELFVFGALDVNAALLNFLGKEQVAVHFFDFYEHYSGSFMPREYLLAGKMQMEQVKTHLTSSRRLTLAQAFIEGATANMLKNLTYYDRRGRDIEPLIGDIEKYRASVPLSKNIAELMGIEGNCRQVYYEAFNTIIQDFDMNNRTRQPPSNEVNAIISFSNMMCYSTVLSQIHHTQLNPTISFLHEPGVRRYSLALDISEIFKPLLVDRMIFKLFNKREIRAEHFDRQLNGCRLNTPGRKIVVKEWDDRLSETIKHRSLGRHVSYRHLIRIECHKIQKYILNIDDAVYKPFKIYW